jgi:hypothetical protein
LLPGEGSSNRAFREFLGDIFFGDNGSNFTSACSSSDFDDLLGELKSPDGDNLPLDAFAINEDSLVADDIDDGGEFALEGAVVNPCDAAYFNEFAVSLNRSSLTIANLW